MRRLVLPGIGMVVAVMVALAGCGVAATPPSPVPGASVTTSAAPKVTKILVFVVENHSLDQMKTGMPYTFTQAEKYGYAANYQAIRHPSLPNYIAITSGSTHGIADDQPPAAHPVAGPSVFGQALATGRTATVYADGMTEPCATSDGGDHYAVRHNPWTYYVDERTECGSHDVGLDQLTNDIDSGLLPNVGMVVPNTCNDAHDCPLATADQWFNTWMTQIYAGNDWKSGQLAVVLTADEDDHASDNIVLTVVIHPSQNHHVVDTPLTHYSLTRLYQDVAHTDYLNSAGDAESMAAAFGLPV